MKRDFFQSLQIVRGKKKKVKREFEFFTEFYMFIYLLDESDIYVPD